MSATQSEDFPAAVLAQLHEAEYKAWESLSGYKFLMFGYWAGLWVTLNRIGGWNFKNPWRDLVKVARYEIGKREVEREAEGAIDISHPLEAYLSQELRASFIEAADEVFHDGMDSAFSRKLRSFIQAHGDLAIRAIDNELQDKEVNVEVAGEVLRQVGSIADPKTHHCRLTLLLQELESPDPRIRDAASLGIEALEMAEE